MVQSAPKTLTVDEFITYYGDSDHYELIDGELINVEPTGPHEQVSAFVGRKLNVEIDRQDVPYFIPHRCLIKLLGTETAFRPDVIVLDQTRLINEPLWQQEPVITSGAYQEFKNANDLSGFYETIAWKSYAEQDWEPKYTIFASPGHLPILRIGGYGKQGNDRDIRVREFFNNGYLPINDIGQHRYPFVSLNSSNILHELNLRADQIRDGENQVFSYERIKRCDECLGTGATPKTCQLCQGQGFSLITDSVTIQINSNFKNGQTLPPYPEKGHDGRYCDSKGNLVIRIKIV